jgi:hypothetical protein
MGSETQQNGLHLGSTLAQDLDAKDQDTQMKFTISLCMYRAMNDPEPFLMITNH